MVKQSPSRNHRSKGIKVQHILQICVLLAVCFWLIYQVKHSHDKKKAFDEHDAKISQTTHVPDEILKFGRKDLQPRLEETITKNEKHDEEEEEEEETGGEEEDNNEEQEEDSKTEEKDDEGRGGGDGEIDENDQEKSEIEAERDEEFIDEEKEREEGDEKETEEKDSEDKEGWNENEKETEEKDSEDKEGRNENEKETEEKDSEDEGQNENEKEAEEKDSEDEDQNENEKEAEEKDSDNKEGQKENEKEAEEKDSRDGGSRSAHEAREENYKGDDASSAVTHDNEAITTETERGSVDNSKEESDMDNQEEESKSNDTMGSEAEKGENGTSPNLTGKEDKGSFEIVSSKSEDSLPLNSNMTIESNTQQELGNNSTEQHLDVHNILLQKGTETRPDATEAQMGGTATEDLENNPNIASNSTQSESNLIATIGESSNSSTTMDFTLSEKVETSNALVGVEGQSESLTKEENADGTQIEKSETSNGTDKSQDSSEKGNTDEVHHDSINSSNSSVPLEEKNVTTDLDTLPEIRNKGSNNEDAAAE